MIHPREEDTPNPTVPPHLVWFAQALTPVAVRMDALARAQFTPSRPERDFAEEAKPLLDNVSRWLGMLSAEAERLMREVVDRPDVTETQVYFVVGGFDRHCAQLNDFYRIACSLGGDASQRRGTELLAAFVQDLARQFHGWLHMVVCFLKSPEDSDLRHRAYAQDGKQIVEFHLGVQAPPQADEIMRIIYASRRK